MGRVSEQEWDEAGLTGWVRLGGSIHTRITTGSFVVGAKLVAGITELAEGANHHPDLTLQYPFLEVRLLSHDAGRVTDRDLALARQIDELVAGEGLTQDPDAVAVVEWGLDTADGSRLTAFWRAILGYPDSDKHDEALDPSGLGPDLWWQRTEEHETPRQRWHPDIWVSAAESDRREAAALAAGGSLVDDSERPSFIVLADADGNRACLCTTVGRG